jgi:transcriptional regulator with XRE-family HTH domain
MTNIEFRAIRQRLGLTQAQLSHVLQYASALTVSTYERDKNPRPIPTHVGLLMLAYDEGYRPKDWPANRP